MSAARPLLRPVSDRVPDLLAELEREAGNLPPEQLPGAIGALERLKALWTLRLYAPAAHADPDRLLTVEEAAQRLSLAPDTVYRKARSFPFTVRLPGRQVRFSEAGIERYIASRQRR